jgi:putative ABC transport system substrate-binding protein
MAGPAQVALPGTLKGNRSHRSTKTADVPVMQSNKFEVVIRAQTARTLGLSAPPQLLAIANQLIE